MKNFAVLFFVLALSLPLQLHAQDFGFGFGDSSDSSGNSGSGLSASVGGEVSATFIGYGSDFYKGAPYVEFGDIFSGLIKFSAGVSFAEAIINLNIAPTAQPVAIDEAYVRAYLGNFEIEGGIRKLTWGKADSFGPLDVINPLDNSEFTNLNDLMNFKIARPLVRLSYRFGSFSKLESVFVPSFEPMRFADDGRWVQAQMAELKKELVIIESNFGDLNTLLSGLPSLGISGFPKSVSSNITKEDELSMIKYAQAGLRFTTTIGPADIGMQYYYGRLTKPAFSMIIKTLPNPPMPIPNWPETVLTSINYVYNPYHQIGIDWAQVLFGFNIRAEFAANITEDLSGDDEAVYNPHLAWSFGFDRELFSGVNLSLQANETIRLLDSKISSDKLIIDTETGTDVTATQIIAAIYRNFFRDQLEARVAVFWEIEANDFMLVPSLVWTKDALSFEISGGIFGGDKEGPFGQFKDNNFVKAVMTYSF